MGTPTSPRDKVLMDNVLDKNTIDELEKAFRRPTQNVNNPADEIPAQRIMRKRPPVYFLENGQPFNEDPTAPKAEEPRRRRLTWKEYKALHAHEFNKYRIPKALMPSKLTWAFIGLGWLTFFYGVNILYKDAKQELPRQFRRTFYPGEFEPRDRHGWKVGMKGYQGYNIFR